MKFIAAGFLAAFLVSAPALTFASPPAPGKQSAVCKKLLADERGLTIQIRHEQSKANAATVAINEADRAIKDLGSNPGMASAVAALRADRARQTAIRAGALARVQADKNALKGLEEQALRVCPKQSSK